MSSPLPVGTVKRINLIDYSSRRKVEELNRKQGSLYLTKATNQAPYEIIFHVRGWIIDEHYLLWRLADRDQARDRFNLMTSILKAVYYRYSIYQGQPFEFFKKLVRAMAERPAWREVHIAARNGYDKYFKRRTFEPALLNQQHQPDMMTPLHVAILFGFSKTVLAILKQRPQIDLLDAERNSVLHYAALTGHQDILRAILREPGARALLVRNEKRWNPVELICCGENEIKHQQENLKIILKWGLTVRQLTMVSKPGRPIHPNFIAWLAKLDDEHLVKFTDANLKHLNLAAARRGGCPLHAATDASLIDNLLASGFNVDTPNIDGDRPLALAIKRGDLKCTLALLCHDANTNLCDKFGDAPLHLAIRAGDVSLVKKLHSQK